MCNLTKRQWKCLSTICIVNFFLTACASLEGPFYPQLAISKGCTATEFGFVFSIFEIVTCVVSPVVGHYLKKIGVILTYVNGIVVASISGILFGCLNFLDGHALFLSISLLVRVLQGIGFTLVFVSGISVIAQEFPVNVGVTVAFSEIMATLGAVFGVPVGGALHELGGYTMPFITYGIILLLVAIISFFTLPKSVDVSDVLDSGEPGCNYSILRALKIPKIGIAVLSTVTTTLSMGFLQTTLEPYIAQFSLTPFKLGLVFVIPHIVSACTSVFIGNICDKIISSTVVVIIGAVFECVSFCIIGPASFIPVDPSLTFIIAGLIIHGFGISLQGIGTYMNIRQSTLDHGFQDNLSNNGLISAAWSSAHALGAFIGPSIGGVLFDQVGFRNACMLIVGSQVLTIIMLLFCMPWRCSNPLQYLKLINEDLADSTETSSNNLAKTTKHVEKME